MRVVKQGLHNVIIKVKDKTLTNLLDLPYFEVTGYYVESIIEQDMLHLFCKVTLEASICPNCKTISTIIKEYKERCVRDLDVWGNEPSCISKYDDWSVPNVGYALRKN